MRCLVTGGTGFIGSNLVKALKQQNYDVVVVDKRPPSEPMNVPSVASEPSEL